MLSRPERPTAIGTRRHRTPPADDGEYDGAGEPVLDPAAPTRVGSSGTRIEFGPAGFIAVPADRYWGATTSQSLDRHAISADMLPITIFHAFGHLRRASAFVNGARRAVPLAAADAIRSAAEDAIAGDLDDHFPVSRWQCDYGVQASNTVDETLSSRASELLGSSFSSRKPIHPSEVSVGQGAVGAFAAATHIAVAIEVAECLLPSASLFRSALITTSHHFVSKDTPEPIALSAPISSQVGAFRHPDNRRFIERIADRIELAVDRVHTDVQPLLHLPSVTEASGTGDSTIDRAIARHVCESTGHAFDTTSRPQLSTVETITRISSQIHSLADILAEFATASVYAPSVVGSDINPRERHLSVDIGRQHQPPDLTQSDIMIAVCAHVCSLKSAITTMSSLSSARASLPVIAATVLHTSIILGDAMTSMRRFLVERSPYVNADV